MASLKTAIRETKEYLQLNVDADARDDDALDYISDECGMTPYGGCLSAGTEYCDWECPFS